MKLVVAEKPSVAKAYADVIGAKKRCDGYFEGNGYIVSWCVGHLVELAMPQAYDEKYRKWRKEDLPILPHTWKYQVSQSTRKQFNTLKKLMERSDVTELLCATDAGREGELIFRLVYEQAKCKKPFGRIWLSSMEDKAIKDAFADPRPGKNYDSLYEAAKCRERADWIVGLNATRLFSVIHNNTLNIGRVMTPTLAMVVDREAAISSFVPEPFYVVRITVEDTDFDSKKFKAKDDALKLAKKCKSEERTEVSEVTVKEKKENPPLLYDLTTLQREANKHFGFSAQQTLDYAQSLYEKKLITYPRTDSRYITGDMEQAISKLIQKAAQPVCGMDGENAPATRKLVNDAKVTDHTALLPTEGVEKADLETLPSGEAAILRMVTVRLLSATSVPYRYEETKIALACGGEEFSSTGKRILEEGWKRFEPEKTKETELPAWKKGDAVDLSGISLKEGKTKPPARFTEGTLLRAMETAGKDDMPEEAERSGIGTPATRAGIIEKLVRTGFLIRSGQKKAKVLTPTEKGIFLAGIVPEEIRSVVMTADWEKKLLAIEQGEMTADAFMAEICAFTDRIVREAQEKSRRRSP